MLNISGSEIHVNTWTVSVSLSLNSFIDSMISSHLHMDVFLMKLRANDNMTSRAKSCFKIGTLLC